MSNDAAEPVLFFFGRKDAHARGRAADSGFIVEAGSTAIFNVSDAFVRAGGLSRLRDALLQEGVLIRDGDTLRFVKDYTFNSPSTAAAIICGTPINGRVSWRTKEGVTLKDMQVAGE